jgi:hypothetical protein
VASDDLNPYAPPAAPIGAESDEILILGDQGEAEATRRAHIGHEASVKSIGCLLYLPVPICFLAAALMFFFAFSGIRPPNAAAAEPAFMVGGGIFYLMVGGLNLALGLGLRRLQTWARWTNVVLFGLGLTLYTVAFGVALFLKQPAGALGCAIALLILGYILYLLLSAKASTVFSARYRTIVEQTPHIRARTSIVVKVLVVVLITLLTLAFVGGVITAIVNQANK